MDFKEQYKMMNEAIGPDRGLLQELLREAEKQREKREHPIRYLCRHLCKAFLKVTVTATVVCLCIRITLPVLAANPTIFQLMHLVSPELAQRFVPVQMSDEDQGIRMEVVSASIHDNEAQIYITMQDMEGNRIDASTDLYDSYHIWADASFSVGHCEKVGYDEETGKVTFLITITNDKEIETKKVTFSVREFIARKQYYEDIEIPVPLAEADRISKTMETSLCGVGWNRESAAGYDVDNAKVLSPGQPDGRFPVKGIELTGMGYVDGKLHIQYAVPDSLQNDNHGFFILADSEGNEMTSDYRFSFWGNTEDTKTVMYVDDVFPVPPEQISEYTLRGDFWVSGLYVKGNWRVTFSLEDAVEE